MSGLQEALVFADRIGAIEAKARRQRVRYFQLQAQLYQFSSNIMGEQATRVRVWRRPVKSSNVVIHSAGHLVS
ncbi:hypothetical protein AZE42_01234 [Rhizopogon vesiculosus]|uniref:Uncharacterized protein n=1 Tax=Rhizopogon vesiculosus TaxID=180088 RepID=A0A1J8Q7F8_9AGAM|nr:hypothetical protein AZE42_01234 [Rhizopogon vesiculosus]